MSVPITDEIRGLLALQLLPGLGPRLTAALLERFGSAAAILEATPAELISVPHIGTKLADDICRAIRNLNVQAELELIERHHVFLLGLGQPGYPDSLANIPGAPPLLYVRGNLSENDAKAVALVGSRHCTTYGRRVAERLARGLVQHGYTIISGLARGIDSVAHRAALEAGGRTLAVLAGGMSTIYPSEHKELAQEVEAAGALLSEANMAMEPLAGMFPARNRIISGMSRGVVIIEAAARSGALITASHAADQGRPVFAIPGNIDSGASAGTNQLIRKGATLCRGVEDILEELEGVSATSGAVRSATPPAELDNVQRRVWEFLGEQARHLDEMAQQLGFSVPQLSSALMILEMKRAVRRMPGNRYERC